APDAHAGGGEGPRRPGTGGQAAPLVPVPAQDRAALPYGPDVTRTEPPDAGEIGGPGGDLSAPGLPIPPEHRAASANGPGRFRPAAPDGLQHVVAQVRVIE